MNNLYIFIFIQLCFISSLMSQMPSGYDTTSVAQFTMDEDIHEVSIGTFTNNSSCAGASATVWPSANGLPASKLNRYSNYTGGASPLPVIVLSPGSSTTYSLKLGYEAGNSFGFSYGWAIFIDFNRNGTFDLPGERVANSTSTISSTAGCNFTTISGSFTVPSSASPGLSLMRVVQAEFIATPSPTGVYTWGETEDYKVSMCTPLTRNVVKVDPNCTIDTSGSIKVNASGGSPPLKYSWDGGAFLSIDSLKNKPAGVYTVITKDSFGCKYYDTITLNATGTLSTVKAITNSCANSLTGKIILNPITGTAPFTFSINSGVFGPTSTWTNLGKGQYIIQTKDANNCSKKDTIILDTFTRYFINSKSVDSILCKNDGEISYQFSDTTQYRKFSINGGPMISGNTGIKKYSNLSPATYIVKLEDKNLCSILDTTTLTGNMTSLILKSKLDIGCVSGSLGTIVVDISGKKPTNTYLYNWNHITTPFFSTTDSLSNLSAGIYKIKLKITDINGRNCILDSIQSTIVNLGLNLKSITFLTKPYNCNYDSINVIKVIGIGGKPPYTYSFTNQPHTSGVHSSWAPIDTSLIKYTKAANQFQVGVSIIDGNQCRHDTSLTYFPQSTMNMSINQDTPYACGTSLTNIIRFVQSDHFKSKMPIQYSFNNSAFGTDSVFYNMSGNNVNYPFKFKDNIGCIYSDSFKVTSHPIPSGLYSIVPNVCINGSSAQIIANGTGGTSPYLYSINGVTYQTSGSFTGLTDGKRVIYIKDKNNCKKIDTQIVPNFSYSTSFKEIKSNKCDKDSIAVLVANMSGTDIIGSVFYSVNNSIYSTQDTWTKLPSGKYKLKISYNNVCEYLDSLNVSTPTAIIGNVIQTKMITCKSAKNGEIKINAAGGTIPYQYFVNNVFQSSGSIVGNLDSGSYVVKIKDNNNCERILNPFPINEPDKLVLDISNIVPTTCNLNNGKFSFKAIGGNPGAYITMNSANILAPNTITNLVSNSYKIKLIDNQNCKDSQSFNIPLVVPFNLNHSTKDPSCFDSDNGEINVMATGQKPPFQYLWENNDTTQTRLKLSGKQTYVVKVSDSLGCIKYDTFNLKVPKEINLKLKSNDASCYNTQDGLVSFQSTGGYILPNSQFKYEWNGSFLPKNTNYVANLNPNTYLLKVYDDNLCFKSSTIIINAPQRLYIHLDSIYSLSKFGETVQFIPTISGTSSQVNYYWTPNSSLSCADCLEPIFNGYQNSNFKLIYRYNNDKCIDSTWTSVIVPILNHALFVPNSFSPNAQRDAENESIKVYGNFIQKMRFSIYNRWGIKVFETDTKTNGWNGQYQGQNAPIGEYSYHLEAEFLDNAIVTKSGSITLIR